MASKIRRSDEVVVLSGKDKGKQGKVLAIFRSGKILVEGINLIKKHQKPNPSLNEPGGIVVKEAPIWACKVNLFNQETKKPDRVGFRFENGKKVRFFKSTGKPLVE